MPYKTNDSLPEAVQKYLPNHAQDIYREAFNHAYETYKDASKRREQDDSVEKISHRVAWSAVKSKYEKGRDDIWRKKEEITTSKCQPDQPKKT